MTELIGIAGVIGAVISFIIGVIVFVIFIAMFFKLESINDTLKGIHSLLNEQLKKSTSLKEMAAPRR